MTYFLKLNRGVKLTSLFLFRRMARSPSYPVPKSNAAIQANSKSAKNSLPETNSMGWSIKGTLTSFHQALTNNLKGSTTENGVEYTGGSSLADTSLSIYDDSTTVYMAETVGKTSATITTSNAYLVCSVYEYVNILLPFADEATVEVRTHFLLFVLRSQQRKKRYRFS